MAAAGGPTAERRGDHLRRRRVEPRGRHRGPRPQLRTPRARGADPPAGDAVGGGLEIAAQVRDGELPAPRHVFVPAGTGGIAAGLLVGLGMAGIDATIHAVRVADRLWANRPLTLLHARRTVGLLRRHGADVDLPRPDRLVFDHGWIGADYGVPTIAGERAARLAAAHGLTVEPTYTAKALAAALAALRSADVSGPVLWVNTVNSRPL